MLHKGDLVRIDLSDPRVEGWKGRAWPSYFEARKSIDGLIAVVMYEHDWGVIIYDPRHRKLDEAESFTMMKWHLELVYAS